MKALPHPNHVVEAIVTLFPLITRKQHIALILFYLLAYQKEWRVFKSILTNPEIHLQNAVRRVGKLEIRKLHLPAALAKSRKADKWHIYIDANIGDNEYKFISFIHELVHIALYEMGIEKHNEYATEIVAQKIQKDHRHLCLELLMQCTWKTPSSD